MQLYKINAFAKLLGKSVRTLQRWDVEGILVAKRNPNNRRYYTHDQYLNYLGIINFNKSSLLYTFLNAKTQKRMRWFFYS